MKSNNDLSFWIKKSNILNIFSSNVSPYFELYFFHKGDAICQEGEKLNKLFFLVKGKAKLFITHSNGKISLIDFLFSPTIIGEMEFLGAQLYSNGIVALTDCICIAISTGNPRSLLTSDAHFLNFLCLFLSKKTLRNTAKFSLNSSYTLKERLANFILLSEDACLYKERHTEVAEYLDVSYRHLLYVLAEFRHNDILKKLPKGYLITNYEALVCLSEDIRREQEPLSFKIID